MLAFTWAEVCAQGAVSSGARCIWWSCGSQPELWLRRYTLTAGHWNPHAQYLRALRCLAISSKPYLGLAFRC